MSTQQIAGKRILVTGGTTGIGRETVKLLAGMRARLLTFGRHAPELGDALAYAALPEEAGLVADAAKREDIDMVFAAVDERLGGIDALVACAGLGAQPIFEMAEEDWRTVVETNLMGYMACARAAIRRMEASGGGHLLFVGSISPHIKAPGESVYAATKAGVEAMTHILAKELGPRRITVNAVAPGPVDTELFTDGKSAAQIEAITKLIPLGRLGQPDDIAGLVAFLAGPDSQWVNGQIIRANGGAI